MFVTRQWASKFHCLCKNELGALSAEYPAHCAELSETSVTHSAFNSFSFCFHAKHNTKSQMGNTFFFFYISVQKHFDSVHHPTASDCFCSFSDECVGKHNYILMTIKHDQTSMISYLLHVNKEKQKALFFSRVLWLSLSDLYKSLFGPHHYGLLPARNNGLYSHPAACIPNQGR